MDKKKRVIPFGYGYNEEEAFKGELTFIDDELKKSEEADKEQFSEVSYDEGSKQIQFSNVKGEVVATLDASQIAPSATVIEDVTYDSATQMLIIKFDNGQTIDVDMNDLINAAELEEEIASKADASALTEVTSAVTDIQNAMTELETKVDGKADSDSVYTKSEVDTVIADKADKSELSAEAARATSKEGELEVKDAELQANIDAVDAKADAKADASVVTALAETVDAKANADSVYTKSEVDTVIANKADKSELDNLATKAELNDVEAKIPDVSEKVDWVESTPGRKHIVLKNHDSILGTATNNETYNLAMVSKWDVADFGSSTLHANLNSKDGVVTINDNKQIATTDELPDVSEYAKMADVNTAIETAIAPLAEKTYVDAAVSGKADSDSVYAKSEVDTALGDKADKSEIQGMATETWVGEQGFAKSTDVTDEIATAVAPLAVKAEVTQEINSAVDGLNAAISGKADSSVVTALAETVATKADNAYVDAAVSGKADSDNVYSKSEVDEEVATKADEAQLESLHRKFNALLSIFDKTETDVNNEIVKEELAESNNVVFEDGTINAINVPETTKSKTVTAELEENTEVNLTSRYGVTINNTSENPTNLNIKAPYVEGYNAATITLNSGEYNTVTLKDASLTVNTGSSVQNVVIDSETAKPLTINAKFAEGAMVTSEANVPITLTNKNAEGEEVSITLNAPNSTVTLSGGKWVAIEATVSDNTLIISNTAHITNLSVKKGNVIVKVARQADIKSVVENYTLETGCTIDYLKDEVTNANQSILNTTGEHTIMEDITHSGNYSVSVLSRDSIVWKLNNHSVTMTNTRGFAGFRIRANATLELNGPGAFIVPEDYGVWLASNNVTDASVIVNGGDFKGATHVLYAEKGVIEVNGGSFMITNPDECDKDPNGNFRFLLNCLDANYKNGTANIVVRGGKFYDFDPGNCYAEGEGTSFLADGYVSIESTEVIEGVTHRVYTVMPQN